MLDLIIAYKLIHAKNIFHLINHQVYFKLVDRDMKNSSGYSRQNQIENNVHFYQGGKLALKQST